MQRLIDLAVVEREKILSVRELTVLAYVSGCVDGCGVRDAAAVLDIPKPSVVRAFDSLCLREWATRATVPADRRLVTLRLTGKGLKIAKEIFG